MKRHTLTLFACIAVGTAPASEPSPYLFFDFNDPKRFPAGPLDSHAEGLQTLDQEAAIVRASQAPQGHLEVTGSVVLLSNRLMLEGQTHLEAWVQPQAQAEKNGTEFLDFDGAALALFQTENQQAEIHALHVVDDRQAFWISTGMQIPIVDGRARDWRVIQIRQHWERGTWDLAVDGITVLQGLGRGRCADGKLTEVWLYGHGESEANAFDDLLLSADPPEVLEQNLKALHQLRLHKAAEARAQQEKRIARHGRESQRRKSHLTPPDPRKAATPRLLDLKLKVVGGGRHITEFESTRENGTKQRFALYSPQYDENGKPKPLELEIRCDAELQEGATLGAIEWAITDQQEDSDSSAQVILHGTFERGPRLMVTVPSEWSNKPLSIVCGRLGLMKR